MGREIRRVRPDWKHPKDDRGKYIPLLNGMNFREELEYFKADADSIPGEVDPPDPKDYTPVWTPEEATACQAYETVSEGTPVSPVFTDPEELARWISEHGLGGINGPMPLEQARRFVEAGWAPSLVVDSEGIQSGAHAIGKGKGPVDYPSIPEPVLCTTTAQVLRDDHFEYVDATFRLGLIGHVILDVQGMRWAFRPEDIRTVAGQLGVSLKRIE